MFPRMFLSIFLTFVAGGIAQADEPQAVIIQTTIAFVPLAEGTFTATAPLCTSGTVRTVRAVFNPSLLRGHGFTGRAEFTCDDNSGTFIIQLHPQAGSNYAGGTREPEFTLTGPWSIVIGGTGRYAKLTGHGDFGVVIDFEQDPWTGEESYVGFVQLK